ncbi:MAG: NACHT domain-containing protein [Streptosporangiales bacterium]|nr:NACHT domain-containing protein [Streptosporangiales bacterium]
MSDIALAVGAAVVKVATKVWLGAPPASSVGDAGVDTVTEVIKGRVAGRLEQRRVRRQFEHLEETVAGRVLAVLGHEFADVPENEREAAVLAVADTFDASRLHDTELYAQDLDPLYLERHIRATTPIRVRDLSPGAVALFDRVLAECCTYVILLSTALPTFNAAAFTEILRRERTLIEKVDELLARVPEPDTGDTAAAEFGTAYRRHLMARLDRLDLFGADVRTRRYPLTLAYVGLNAISGTPAAARDPGRSAGDAGIQETLASTRRLLLRGNAGSGKTTLLQWLAVRAAGRDFPLRLEAWNDHVPFLIRLREYVDRGLPSPAAFLRSSGRHLRYAMPEGWVEELLNSGRALVLVDGVDELPERKRPAVRRWLRDLVEDFPAARYVITSRPAAVREGWLDDDGFTTAELAPMGPSQIRGFIENWHAAVRSEIVDVEEHERLDRYGSPARGAACSSASSPTGSSATISPTPRATGPPHTFEEYLAARAIIDQDRIGMLIDKAADDQWREVIAMAAGHATTATREELITGLLDRADTEAPRRLRPKRRRSGQAGLEARILITALACMRNTRQLSEALSRRLSVQAAGVVVPPESDEHAQALVSAGEFGLDLLLGSPGRFQPGDLARTVQVAARIGGPRAFGLIEEVTRELAEKGPRFASGMYEPEILHAVRSAWTAFDPEEYAAGVLSGTVFGESLAVADPSLIAALRLVDGLTSLSVEWRGRWFRHVEPGRLGRATDALADIGELSGLRSLSLEWLPSDLDLSPLTGLTGLRELLLDGIHSARLRPVAALASLERLALCLSDSGTRPDLSPLDRLPALRRLVLFGRRDYDVRSMTGSPGLTIVVSPEATLSGEERLHPEVVVDRSQGLRSAPGVPSVNWT